MQDELQAELEEELERYGIDPQASGMSDQQYSDAMADLQQRREQLLAGKPPSERRRVLAMRNTMLWHLNNVSICSCNACIHLVFVCVLCGRSEVDGFRVKSMVHQFSCIGMLLCLRLASCDTETIQFHRKHT